MKKKYWIILLCFISFIIVSGLILPQLGRPGESSYYKSRVHALKNLHTIFNVTGNLDVFYSSSLGYGLSYPYDHSLISPALISIQDESEYYQKVLRYKVIKSDNWWGIVELEYGIIGKYFLMITKDGDIIKFDNPFLPDQKLAEYPPKYDIDNHSYPAYLDSSDNRNTNAMPYDSDLAKQKRDILKYSKMIELNPNDATLYRNRGAVYSQIKQFDKAIQDMSKAVELKPYDTMTYWERGSTYLQIKQFDKAIQDMSKIIELKPDGSNKWLYPFVYFCRGNIYSKMQQQEKAVQDYSKYIELLNPGNKGELLGGYWYRGNSYNAMKQYDKTIQDYSKVIDLKPDYPDSYNRRACIYATMRQYENAIQDYSKSIELKQDCNETYLCIMEICIIAARPEQFSQWLRQFETAIPGNKLSKENLLTKLYLVCLNRCVLNEQRTDVENQLDALLKGEVKLKWSFDLINEWLDNSKNSLTPEQIKYIRGLTDKVKVMGAARQSL